MMFLRLDILTVTSLAAIVFFTGKSEGQTYVTGGHASSEWSSSYALTKGYSPKGAAQTPSSCFYSQSNTNQYAFLYIPKTNVKEIKLLSYSTEMKDTYVQVCTDENHCVQCGQPTQVATGGAWATFLCDTPISGNEIKVIQNNNYLAFCEVEVTSAEDYASSIHITGGQASSEWSSGWALSQGYTLQGGSATPSTCFYSKSNSNQYADLYIPLSYVAEVRLLSYSSEMKGTEVEICKSNQCTPCGAPATINAGQQWETFDCGDAIQGDVVKVKQDNNYLAFCEVEVKGATGGSSGGDDGSDSDSGSNSGSGSGSGSGSNSGSDSGSGSGSGSCGGSCTDYHRFCRKLFDANFEADYKKFLESEEAQNLGISPHEAPEGDCETSGFYQQFCPNTCNNCNC